MCSFKFLFKILDSKLNCCREIIHLATELAVLLAQVLDLLVQVCNGPIFGSRGILGIDSCLVKLLALRLLLLQPDLQLIELCLRPGFSFPMVLGKVHLPLQLEVKFTALLLVLTGQQQPLVTQQPQHGRLGHLVPVMAGQRPDLAMPPRRFGQRMPHHQIPRSPTSRLRPRPLRTAIRTGLGLPPAPRASGMSINFTNLAVDMPASMRITSRSSKGPTCPPPTSSTPGSRQRPHPTPESTQ